MGGKTAKNNGDENKTGLGTVFCSCGEYQEMIQTGNREALFSFAYETNPNVENYDMVKCYGIMARSRQPYPATIRSLSCSL